MYKEITSKDSVTDLYFKKLLSKGIVEEDKYKEFKKNYRSHMEKGETVAESLATDPDESIHFDWTPYLEPDMTKSYPTAVSNESLKETMKTVLAFDKDFLMPVEDVFSINDELVTVQSFLKIDVSAPNTILFRHRNWNTPVPFTNNGYLGCKALERKRRHWRCRVG